jgi:hypothetical protein
MTGLAILLVAWAAHNSPGSDAGRDIPASLEGWQKVSHGGTPLKIFPPELPNLDFSQGIGSAKGFADGKGKLCVLISAGVNSGPQEATLKVTTSKALKSKYGHTTRNSDGSYTFLGKDICYDVLDEE